MKKRTFSGVEYDVTVSARIPASVEQVWSSWVDPKLYGIIHGTHRSEVDLRVGGRHRVVFFADRDGEETFVYDEITPHERLVFHWQEHPHQRVSVHFAADRHGDTRVSIQQSCGTDRGFIHNGVDGWAWVLDATRQYFETGAAPTYAEWSERIHA